MSTTQPIRSSEQIKEISDYFFNKGQYRNYFLIIFSIYTALRMSDTLSLKWGDLYDYANNRVRPEITITERKTGKSKTIKLHEELKRVILTYKDLSRALPKQFLFSSRKGGAISRVQAYRIIKSASTILKWEGLFLAILFAKLLDSLHGSAEFLHHLSCKFITTAVIQSQNVIWGSHKQKSI